MTKKNTTTPSEPEALAPEQRAALRAQLGEFMRSTRQAHKPAKTQMALSKLLGYTYSIVTSWENNSRVVLEGQLLAWAKALDVKGDLQTGPLAQYAQAVQPDITTRPNSGSRVQEDVNRRLKLLREKRSLSIREMATFLGISTTHYFRIEKNQSNLTLEQLRQVSMRLDVSYDYLLDGKGEGETYEDLKARVAKLERENQLLESFRKQVEINQK